MGRHVCVHFAKIAILTIGVALAPGLARAAATFFGPAAYLQNADSPFSGASFAYFHLENFEDGALNTPGASASSGWIVASPGSLTDSVDADDGAVNGTGTGGRSFYSGGANSSLTITFNASALGGNLPTHVGIVWTDVGNATPTLGFGDVLFSALGANGDALGNIGGSLLGDGSAGGATAEDRFFGVSDPTGISQITLSMPGSVDWEVDHLQYGFARAATVSEPGSLLLMAAIFLGGWRAGGRGRQTRVRLGASIP